MGHEPKKVLIRGSYMASNEYGYLMNMGNKNLLLTSSADRDSLFKK